VLVLNTESPSTYSPKGFLLQIGSPNKLKDRTFQVTFRLLPAAKPQRSRTQMPTRTSRNPIIMAQEWQQALHNGTYSSAADLARKLGISRARVAQVLHLLKLEPDALNAIAAFGDPLPSRAITERMLRSIVHHSAEEQRRELQRILTKVGQLLEPPSILQSGACDITPFARPRPVPSSYILSRK
jgi:hypothetical protein